MGGSENFHFPDYNITPFHFLILLLYVDGNDEMLQQFEVQYQTAHPEVRSYTRTCKLRWGCKLSASRDFVATFVLNLKKSHAQLWVKIMFLLKIWCQTMAIIVDTCLLSILIIFLKILTKYQVYVILIYSNFSPEKRGTQRGGLLDVTMNYNQITY